MRRYRFSRMLKIAAIAALVLVAVSFVVMSLWNAVMPGILAARTITFWQATGLLILSKLLFGGFRSYGGNPGWRRRLIERWEQMTPEERERFRRGMRHGCDFRAEAGGRNKESEVRA